MKLINLYENIKFFIDEAALVEEYPTTWNADEFAKLRTFADRARYAEKNLKRISSGTGRAVYKIDNEKVLKLAKNRKGVAQNEVEIDLGNSKYFSVLANVFSSHPDGLWVEMELARKCTIPLFQQINGYSFNDYSRALFNVIQSNRGRSRMMFSEPTDNEKITESEFFNDVVEYLMGTDSPDGDMRRLNSYGVVSRGGEDTVVVIDYGLNKDVYSTYYSQPLQQYYG